MTDYQGRLLHRFQQQREFAAGYSPLYASLFGTVADWLAVRGDDPGPLFYAIRRGGHVQAGQGVTTEALAQMLAKRCEQAGIAKRTTWHDFRRTVAGDLLDNGADVVTVQKIGNRQMAAQVISRP